MLYFCDELYTTESIRPKMNQIKFKLISGIGTVNLYLITFASNELDVFDIYASTYFKQKNLRKRDFYIVGMAESQSLAYELIQTMIQECIDNTGSANNIRSYFEKKFLGAFKW